VGDVDGAADRPEDGALHRGGEMVRHQERRHQVLVMGGEHTADDGDADGATDLKERAVGGGTDAGMPPGQRAHDGSGHRGDGQAGAHAEHDHARHGARVCGGDRRGGDLPQACGDDEEAGGHDELGADPAIEQRGERRDDGDGPRRRNDAHARGQRTEAEVELEVLGQNEERAEQPEHDETQRQDRGREAPVTEELEPQHRVRGDPLPDGEEGENAQSAGAGADHDG
jgi:hypothetical protein